MTNTRSAVSADASDDALLWLDNELHERELLPGNARALLDKSNTLLKERFLAGEPVAQLVQLRAQLVDHVLTALWQHVL